MPDTVKITFNLGIASRGNAGSIVHNVSRTLVKRKVLMLEPHKVDTINNSNIHDIYRDFYVSKETREEKLLQVIQSALPLD